MDTVVHTEISLEAVWSALENVKDPEIPVLTVVDMGIITDVKLQTPNPARPAGGTKLQTAVVTMTPTFVGCPAIDVMKKSIEEQVKKLGFDLVEVNVDFETPWTSNRMSAAAKEKLEKFGLAPPATFNDELSIEQLNNVRCPHCGSTDTTLRSSFGSTLCRAIRFCFNCKQGFEQFKPI